MNNIKEESTVTMIDADINTHTDTPGCKDPISGLQYERHNFRFSHYEPPFSQSTNAPITYIMVIICSNCGYVMRNTVLR